MICASTRSRQASARPAQQVASPEGIGAGQAITRRTIWSPRGAFKLARGIAQRPIDHGFSEAPLPAPHGAPADRSLLGHRRDRQPLGRPPNEASPRHALLGTVAIGHDASHINSTRVARAALGDGRLEPARLSRANYAAFEPILGALVVIELKAGLANDAALGQVLGYMGAIKRDRPRWASMPGPAIRGTMVAKEFSDRVRHASRAVPNLRLVSYAIQFTFEDRSFD